MPDMSHTSEGSSECSRTLVQYSGSISMLVVFQICTDFNYLLFRFRVNHSNAALLMEQCCLLESKAQSTSSLSNRGERFKETVQTKYGYSYLIINCLCTIMTYFHTKIFLHTFLAITILFKSLGLVRFIYLLFLIMFLNSSFYLARMD